MFCTFCGSVLKDGAKFCVVCGNKVDEVDLRTMAPGGGLVNQPGVNQPGMNQPGMNQSGMNQQANGMARNGVMNNESGFVLPPVGIQPDTAGKKPDFLESESGMYGHAPIPNANEKIFAPGAVPTGFDGPSYGNTFEDQVVVVKNEQPKEEEQKKKPRKKWPIFAAIGGAALVAAGVVLWLVLGMGKAGGSVSLNDYVKISANGYDGYGSASLSFDTKRFVADYDDKMNASATVKKLMKQYTDTAAEVLLDTYVQYEMVPFEDLSNGDEITVTWKIDDKLIKDNFGIDIQYSDMTYKVDGLDAVGEIDVFTGVEVSFEGIDNYGTARASVNTAVNPALEFVKIEIDPESGLSNGDEVNVTVSLTISETYFISKFGGLPAETTKAYVVEGLGKEVDTLSGKDIQELIDYGHEKIEESINLSWSFSTERYDSCTYLGYCYEKLQNGMDSDQLILIYRVDAGNEDMANFSFYTYVTLYNLAEYEGGVIKAESEDYGYRNELNKNVIYIPDTETRFYYWGYPTMDEAVQSIMNEMDSNTEYEIQY